MVKLPYKIYSFKVYWFATKRWERLLFQYRRRSYNAKDFIDKEKHKATSTLFHVKRTVWSILRAIAFVIILYAVEYFANSWWPIAAENWPDWIIQAINIIPKPTYPEDKDAIIELISVIASLNGVILALFYPILATIISTAYSKVHDSIRNLILREKETQAYLKKLTFITAFSIITLLACSFGYEPGNLILSILVGLALVSLFFLLKIGSGVYTLLEPSNLLKLILFDISEFINGATIKGVYWNDRSFQRSNYMNAYQSAESINLVTQLCIEEYVKESSFKASVQTSLYILSYYLQKKQMIPVESLWFPISHKHSSYFESDMTLRNIAKSTNTFVQPGIRQDHYWLEEKIIGNISSGWEAIIKYNHVYVFSETIAMTYSVFEILGSSVDVKTAEILLSKLHLNIKQLQPQKGDASGVIDYEDWRNELGCIETYLYAYLRFEVGVFEKIAKFDAKKFSNEYDKIAFKHENTIYATDFIPDLHDRLNGFKKLLANEYYVEGMQVTPDWYIKQALASDYLRIIDDKLNQTISFLRSYVVSISEHFDKKNPLLSSFAALMSLELMHKTRFRLAECKVSLESIDTLEVCIGEFKWIKPDLRKIEEQVALSEKDCLLIITNNMEALSTVKWSDKYPDVFSHSYSVLSTNINECFEQDDLDRFKLYFTPFLKSSINAFGNLNKIFKHYQKPQNISYQVLIDIMEISGYAYLYSVVYKKPEYWDYVKESWDKHFVPLKENIDLMATFYGYFKRKLYGTGLNYNESHDREIVFKNVLQKGGITPATMPDPLVRIFISDSYYPSFYEPAELFLELYLFTFISAKHATTLITREIFRNILRTFGI